MKLKPFVAEDYLDTEEARAAFKAEMAKTTLLDENWMRVAPGTDAAIWRPWSRETGEL
jgi:hypothetical protein